jgi:HSP20 family protein
MRIVRERRVIMNGMSKYDPFAEMRALQKQLFDDDFDNWFSSFKGLQLATTDVYTKDNKELIVEAHLPNFEDNDVDVSVDNGTLVIQAEKHEKDEDKGKKYVMRESSSSFYRRLRLPERAQADGVEAHMDNGVLRVRVPLRELPEPKRIQIASSKSKKK